MSILGGLIDEHHEMELTPSTQLVTSNWLARHIWTVLAAAVVLALGLWLGVTVR